MQLSHPPVDTEWLITQSFLINHPPIIASDTLPELRSRVGLLAREASRIAAARDKPRLGEIEFRYETDTDDLVTVVHCYFKGVGGVRRRFMRLERQDHAST
jgi:hypothetical protein